MAKTTYVNGMHPDRNLTRKEIASMNRYRLNEHLVWAKHHRNAKNIGAISNMLDQLDREPRTLLGAHMGKTVICER